MEHPALCHGADRHAFSNTKTGRQHFTDTYCANCPDIQECLETAYRTNRDGITVTDPVTLSTRHYRHPIQDGVWGGVDFTSESSRGREPLTLWKLRTGQTQWEKENPA